MFNIGEPFCPLSLTEGSRILNLPDRNAFAKKKMLAFVQENRFLNTVPYFKHLFPSPTLDLYLNKLNNPSPEVALCQVCLKLVKRFLRK